jgi:hypothetical protein
VCCLYVSEIDVPGIEKRTGLMRGRARGFKWRGLQPARTGYCGFRPRALRRFRACELGGWCGVTQLRALLKLSDYKETLGFVDTSS